MSRPGSAGAHLTLRLQRVTSEAPPTPDTLAVGPWHVTLDAHDPHGQMVTVIRQPHLVAALLGTLYDRSLQGALERYRAVGDGFAAELEGSFALVILDLGAGRVLALTDRVGTRSLYASPAGDEVSVSTRPDLPEFTRRPVCVSAVTSMLVNGFLPSGLTLYGGVRALTPAQLHDVCPDRVHSATYWTVPFSPAAPARPAAAHAGELIEVLRGAVSRRLRASGERPYLSLSGGYDSRGLLSLLRGQHPNLKTFSYSLPTVRDGSDTQAAIRLAAEYGVPHQHLLAYRGDLSSVIGLNAHLGQGVTPFCEEIDALQELATLQPTDIFTGEQVFELRTHPHTSASEVLGRIQVNDGRELRWIAPYLSGGTYDELHAAWMLEYDALLAQCGQWPSGPHRELELMIRQNEPSRLLPWRERFVGRSANIHVPYLDTQVLDFLGHLPVSLMADKRILKVALRQMDSQLFHVPLATTQGYEANWQRELLMLDEGALGVLLGFPSRLDALIDPPTIRRLMRALLPGEVGAGKRLNTATRHLVGSWRRTPLGRWAFGHPPIRPRVPKLPAVLLHLLTLREVLRCDTGRA